MNIKNKPVLVTGATGFVGQHLVKSLVEKNAKVFVLSHSRKDPEILKKYKGRYVSVKGTVEDLRLLNRIVKDNNIRVIYHLAGKALVEEGKKSPIETFEVNIRGTWNVLEAARVKKMDKVIIASTTHVYGNNPNLPYMEEYYPQPTRPYETSKASADLLAQSYADSFNVPVEIPRFVNIYGPGDVNFSRLVPKVIKSVLEDAHPSVWDVGAVRDFLYVEDAVRAYIKLAEKDLPNNKRVRVVNIGTGKPWNIVTVSKKIIRLSGKHHLQVKAHKVPKEREKEIKKQYISIDKARTTLGWKPKYSLEKGLSETIDWYRYYLGYLQM